jgi:hypothetical protein
MFLILMKAVQARLTALAARLPGGAPSAAAPGPAGTAAAPTGRFTQPTVRSDPAGAAALDVTTFDQSAELARLLPPGFTLQSASADALSVTARGDAINFDRGILNDRMYQGSARPLQVPGQYHRRDDGSVRLFPTRSVRAREAARASCGSSSRDLANRIRHQAVPSFQQVPQSGQS